MSFEWAPKNLRVGYFSTTFRNHPVTRLTASIFENHNRDNVKINFYSLSTPVEDAICKRTKKACDSFYDLSTLNDEDVVEIARSHQLDIAIDLSGYTDLDRSNIFAARVAPIQLNFLGYPGTSGAKSMDYIVADKTLIPQNCRSFYSERVIYLPDCYQPQDARKPILNNYLTRSEINLPENHFVYCCFNNSFKIEPNVFDSWMKILKAVPESVLWLLQSNSEVEGNLRTEARRRNISSNRLIFSKRVTYNQYISQYQLADLFLDTFNYGAGATASDALKVGLPLLTMAGKAYTSRMAASLLAALDLEELITHSPEQYEQRAISIGNSRAMHSDIKKTLLYQLDCSNLFKADVFTVNLERAFFEVNRLYYSGQASRDIFIAT